MLEVLLTGEKVGVKDASGLQSFVLKLENVYAMALVTGRAGEFDKRGLYNSILSKKLPHLSDKWQAKWSKNEVSKGREYRFKDFMEFLKLNSKIAQNIARNKAIDSPNLAPKPP